MLGVQVAVMKTRLLAAVTGSLLLAGCVGGVWYVGYMLQTYPPPDWIMLPGP